MATIPTTANGAAFNEFNLKECFDATLELLNNWRQHSGLPIMKAWLASDPGDSRSCLLANALSVIALDPTHKLYERTSEHVSVNYDGGDDGASVHSVSLDFPAEAQAASFVKWANEYVGDEHAFSGGDGTRHVRGPAWMAVIAIAFDNRTPGLNEDLFRGEQYVNGLNGEEKDEFRIPTHITAIEASTGHGNTASA